MAEDESVICAVCAMDCLSSLEVERVSVPGLGGHALGFVPEC